MDSEQRQTLLGREYEEAENVEQLIEELAAPIAYDDDASRELRKRLWWREAMINSVFIALWFGFATLLSMYNKWMFSPTYYNFPFPLFVTSTHMVVQFILSSTVRSIWPHIFKPPGHPTVKEYVQKCVPCAVTTGLDIGLSNLSLKTITLSLYTMCKSSSLIFVLIFAFLFKLEKFSVRLVSVILLIAGGVLLMVLSTDVEGHGGPPTDSSLAHTIRAFAATSTMAAPLVVGIMLVFTASACGGLRWALTQLLLTGSHGHGQSSTSSRASIASDEAHSERHHSMGLANPAATIYFLSPSMFLTIFLVSSFVEGPLPTRLAESGFFDNFGIAIKTIGYILFPGVLAFSMVLSEYYVIQRTGIVPMSIAGIFKEVTTILLATLFFHDDMTFVNWIGLFITVCGIAIFTFHKYQKSVESAPGPLDSEISEGEIALPTCHEDGPEPGSGVEAPRRRSSEDMHWSSPKAVRTRSSLDSHEMDATITESAKLLDPSNGEKPSSPPQTSGHNVWLAASTSPGSSKAGKDKDPRKVRFSIAGVGANLPTASDSDDLLDSRLSSSLPSNSFAKPT